MNICDEEGLGSLGPTAPHLDILTLLVAIFKWS